MIDTQWTNKPKNETNEKKNRDAMTNKRDLATQSYKDRQMRIQTDIEI